MLPILLPRVTPLAFTTLGLGLATSTYLFRTHRQRPLLCEPSSPLDTLTQNYLPTSSSSSSSPSRTTTKPTKSSRADLIRQLSLGSVLGVAAGAAVSTFSRVLALLLGVGLVVVQYAASKGYNVIPVSRIQRYVKGINIRSAIEENPALKLSFGTTFALASMATF